MTGRKLIKNGIAESVCMLVRGFVSYNCKIVSQAVIAEVGEEYE